MESEVYHLIIYCVHVHTQLYGTNVIKGSVNDGSGEPLPGVSVAVKVQPAVLSQTWMESSVSMPEIMMY